MVVVHLHDAWLIGRKDFKTGKAGNLLAVSSPVLIPTVSPTVCYRYEEQQRFYKWAFCG